MCNQYKKMFLVSHEGDRGILFADTLKQARQLKRFLRVRGTITEIFISDGFELARVLGGYRDIAKTNTLINELRG